MCATYGTALVWLSGLNPNNTMTLASIPPSANVGKGFSEEAIVGTSTLRFSGVLEYVNGGANGNAYCISTMSVSLSPLSRNTTSFEVACSNDNGNFQNSTITLKISAIPSVPSISQCLVTPDQVSNVGSTVIVTLEAPENWDDFDLKFYKFEFHLDGNVVTTLHRLSLDSITKNFTFKIPETTTSGVSLGVNVQAVDKCSQSSAESNQVICVYHSSASGMILERTKIVQTIAIFLCIHVLILFFIDFELFL